jgi:membrane-associated phospholipid phosphatase
MRLAVPALWLALLGASTALAVLAAQYATLPGDVAILQWAQDQPFPGRNFSDAVRAVTTTQVCLVVGAISVAALALLGRWREAVALGLALIALPLLQSGLKDLVDRPRPAAPLSDVRGSATSPSFPPGHVMSPTVLYSLLLWYAVRRGLPPIARAPLVLWSAFVLGFAGPPNVWLGVHWPSDVLGGWAWGLVIALPAAYWVSSATRTLR